MTFDQYIQNPMGISNSVISNREMYRSMYMEKLNRIMVREMGKVDYQLYKSKNKYYAYIKVPSEVVDKFYYDVVIEFSPAKKMKDDKTLKEYDVRFYSNDPSFVFTFAHAFNKNDMFIKEYSDKMSKQALKEKAKEKNRLDIVGYVKSLYFAYLIMTKYGLFNKIKYINKYDEKFLKSMITPADIKIAQRQEEGANAASAKAKKERAAKRKVQDDTKDNVVPGMIKKTGNIKRTPVVKTMTSNIKRTKKVGRK